MSDFFAVKNLYVNYGEAEALHDISLTMTEGQITTIIGANGAGKTTLVNTIAGILKPRSGSIWLNGADISTVPLHRVADYGVAIVPEGRRLFTKMTVIDNLKMGAYPAHARAKANSMLAFVQELFPRLAERRSQIAGTLSGGEQQMLALGRALMAQPTLLLLDEPSLGLAPIIVQNIFNAIETINRETNLSILLVEQNANLALQKASYAYVIGDGRLVQEGHPDALRADDSIKKAYLGLEHDNDKGQTMPQFYDLNVPLEDSPSEPLSLSITYVNHEQSAQMMAQYLQCDVSDLTDGQGWGVENVQASTHNGTHVDAPWHYFPTSMGKRARTIDEMPLDWFFRDGVRLDFRHIEKGGVITVADLEDALAKINYKLKPYDIVMLWTDTDKLWGDAEYFNSGAGLTMESTLWLTQQGIRVIGTDCWGLDRPFQAVVEQFKKDGDASKIWEAHRAGIQQEYCQIEKLANLDQLPSATGFKIACFPVKVAQASAGWTRVVAIYN